MEHREKFFVHLPDNFMASEWCGESVFLFTFVTQDKSKSPAARAEREGVVIADEDGMVLF